MQITYVIDGNSLTVNVVCQAFPVFPLPKATLPIDFGTIPLGSIGNARLVLFHNENPFPIRIASATSTNTDFRINGTNPTLPITLDPNQSMEVTLTFTPSHVGELTEWIELTSTEPCSSAMKYVMMAIVEDSFQKADLSIDNFTGKLDDVIVVPVELNTDVTASQVTSWSGSISFNPTVLYPQSVSLNGTRSEGMQLSSLYNHNTGVLSMSVQGAKVISGTGALVNVSFRVLLGNDSLSTITPRTDFDFTSGNARVRTRRGGTFSLQDYCFVNGTRLVGNAGGTTLWQNFPNPFRTTTTIGYSTAYDEMINITITDSEGKCLLVLVDEWQRAGEHTCTFDARMLPVGTYYVLLSADGSQTVKKMLLVK